MAKVGVELNRTGGTDLQTTFRFYVHFAADPVLGLGEAVTYYIQGSDLPVAPGEPITWSLPGGMKNFQAGKRTVRPISMTFVVPTYDNNYAGNDGSIYKICQRWANSTYNLNKGTNIGKRNYSTDGISIYLKGEDDTVKYEFRLIRAQVTNCNYGSVNSESNDLIKVNIEMIYDNYKVYDGNGVELM